MRAGVLSGLPCATLAGRRNAFIQNSATPRCRFPAHCRARSAPPPLQSACVSVAFAAAFATSSLSLSLSGAANVDGDPRLLSDLLAEPWFRDGYGFLGFSGTPLRTTQPPKKRCRLACEVRPLTMRSALG